MGGDGKILGSVLIFEAIFTVASVGVQLLSAWWLILAIFTFILGLVLILLAETK